MKIEIAQSINEGMEWKTLYEQLWLQLDKGRIL